MSEKLKSPENEASDWLRQRTKRVSDIVMRLGFGAAIAGFGLAGAGAALAVSVPITIGRWAIIYGLPVGFLGLGGRIATGKPKSEK